MDNSRRCWKASTLALTLLRSRAKKRCLADVGEGLHISAYRSAQQQLNDFGLRKSLDYLDAVRQTLGAVTDRFAARGRSSQRSCPLPVFEQLATPITSGKTRIPGIQIQDTRMIRLMEVLLPSATTITGWPTAEIHQALLAVFNLKATYSTLTQRHYDIRK